MATPDDARRPDGGPLDLLTERAVDAALAATLPLLRANLYRTLAERLPQPSRPTKRPRVALPPGDEPVDELTRAKARATLDRHRRRT